MPHDWIHGFADGGNSSPGIALGVAALGFLGVLATALFTWLGTRGRGQSLPAPSPAPTPVPDDKLRHNNALLVESLREHREMMIQADMTPPPYPTLEPT